LKIVINVDNRCGHYPYKKGIANVLRYCGHQVYLWYTEFPDAPAILDIFSQFKPDILYTNSYSLDSATMKAMEKYPETKLILFSSAHGEANTLPMEYPLVRVTDQEKEYVEHLRKIDRPNFMFLHHHNNVIDFTLGGWKKEFGVNIAGIKHGGDLFTFFKGQRDKNLICDIGYCGGYWAYKGINIRKFIFPLCDPNRIPPLNVKIFGNQGDWANLPQYLGFAQDQTLNNLFASATICPNVHEPHSTDYGIDVVERPFKVISSGGFCISDHVKSLVEDYFPDNEIPTATTGEEYGELVNYYLKNEDEREKLRGRQYKRVLGEHTYFESVADIFANLNMPDMVRDVMNHKIIFLAQNGVNL
jgi:hypothetical protein